MNITVDTDQSVRPVSVRLFVGHSDAMSPIVDGIEDVHFNVTSNGSTSVVFNVTGLIVGKETVLFGFYDLNQVSHTPSDRPHFQTYVYAEKLCQFYTTSVMTDFQVGLGSILTRQVQPIVYSKPSSEIGFQPMKSYAI